MSQAKSRLLELNSKLAQTLADKGVEATADETTTELVNKVADIKSGDDSMLKGIIERSITEVVIPDGVKIIGKGAFHEYTSLTSITIPDSVSNVGDYAFSDCTSLTSITIPDSVTYISVNAFFGCTSLASITLSNSVTSIGGSAFRKCTSLTSITIPDSVTSIGWNVFNGCTSLASITLSNSVTSIGGGAFGGCSSLKEITLENGFNANNLDLSVSNQYTTETIVSWFEALADRTGQSAYTLKIGTTNLAKLTEEQIAIATNKNWTIA